MVDFYGFHVSQYTIVPWMCHGNTSSLEAKKLQQLFRRGLLFSATLPAQLVSFSRAGIKEPAFVRLDVETSLSDVVGFQMEPAVS